MLINQNPVQSKPQNDPIALLIQKKAKLSFVSLILSSLVMYLMVSASPVSAYSDQVINNAEAINKSGRQRMLSQRMMKSYLMIGAGIKVGMAQQQLDDSVALFEEQLLELQDYAIEANHSKVNQALIAVSTLWLSHRNKVLSEPSKDAIKELLKENRQLLKYSNDMVLAIKEHVGVDKAELVDMSGRQRMLSQRIAKVYVALSWHIEDPELIKEFNDSIQLFDQSLLTLNKYQGNTLEIKKSLFNVSNQWKFSKSGFKLEQGGRYVPTVIAVTTESILKKMEKITAMYSDLMAKQGRQLANN
jgi:hypothetical protein